MCAGGFKPLIDTDKWSPATVVLRLVREEPVLGPPLVPSGRAEPRCYASRCFQVPRAANANSLAAPVNKVVCSCSESCRGGVLLPRGRH